MALIVNTLYHRILGLFILGLLASCEPSFTVMKAPPAKPENPLKVQQGFFYHLPAVEYQLQFHGRHRDVQQGELQDFRHLLKMPLPTGDPANALIIDSISLIAHAIPDTNKQYFVSYSRGSRFFRQLTGSAQQATRTLDFTMQQPAVSVKLATGQSQQADRQPEEFERGGSFRENLTKLLNQNSQLLGAVQGLSSDTTFQQDSVLKTEVRQIRNTLEQYQGQIRELKTLFNTFKTQELGARARKLRDIVHKLVELKTGLAGGRQDMNYQNADVHAMLSSLDTMVRRYQKPFRASQQTHARTWTVSLRPDQNPALFRFGFEKRKNAEEYYMEAFEEEEEYVATCEVSFQTVSSATVSTFQKVWGSYQSDVDAKGPFYNIPANGSLTVTLKQNRQTVTLGSTPVQVPQLGQVARLPVSAFGQSFQLDPFYGTLKAPE